MKNLQKNEIRLIVRALVDGDDLEMLPIENELGGDVMAMDVAETVTNIAAVAANVPAMFFSQTGFSMSSALEFVTCAIENAYSKEDTDA